MNLFDKAYSISTDNHGILTARDARANGISSKDIARWVKMGRLVKMGLGVYRTAYFPFSEEDQYAVAVAQAGRDAFLAGESVLGLLRLAPVSTDVFHVRSPRRVRRRIPKNCVVSIGKGDYRPMEVRGIPCQRVPDAIRECYGKIMPERLAEAAREAYRTGFLGKDEMETIQKELENA